MEAATAFFDRTYDETFDLLIEARDYIARGQQVDCQYVTVGGQARMAVETSRLTSRLTHVMAWLLARRAVQAGEITPAEAARPPYTLERSERLAGDDDPLGEVLPPALESLMERSQRLYVRVSRLDELVRRDHADT